MFSSLSRSDRVLAGILLPLAAIAALLAVLLEPPQKEGGLSQHPSTFYNVSYGTKAAYLALEELDFDVERLRRPITPSNIEPLGGLAVLAPIVAPVPGEVETLENWIRAGNTLLIAPDELTAVPGVGKDEPESFADALGLNVVQPGTGPVEQRIETVFSSNEPRRDPLLASIDKLLATSEFRFDAKNPVRGVPRSEVEVLWQDKLGVVLLRFPHGSGQVIALADPYPLTNRGLSEADNAVLLANLAWALSADGAEPIAFDEYHHGFAERDLSPVAMARMVFEGPWGWAAAQAGVVALLWLWASGRRFGAPRDLEIARRRRHGEFAEAAGRLLHEARASQVAHRALAAYYRSRLCRLLNLSPSADDAELVRAVRRVADVSITWIPPGGRHHAGAAGIDPGQLLALTRQWHHAVKAVEHGS